MLGEQNGYSRYHVNIFPDFPHVKRTGKQKQKSSHNLSKFQAMTSPGQRKKNKKMTPTRQDGVKTLMVMEERDFFPNQINQ